MQNLVVVPTYNEAGNIQELASLLFALPTPDLHLMVVDDSSPDGTADLAEALNSAYPGRVFVLRRAAKEGLGPAYIAGFQEALRLGASNVVQMDADLSHPPAAVPRLLAALEQSDIAVGSRYIKGGGIAQGWSILRRILSQGGDWYIRLVLGLPVKDSKSGFKAYRRAVLERLDFAKLRSKGFIFQAEFLYRCYKLGFSMTEVPFTFYDRKAGRSKLSLAIIAEAFWRALRLRLGG